MEGIDRRDCDRQAFARLYIKNQVYLMTKDRVVIGRNSSKGSVDVDMGVSNFISRNHLELFHSQNRLYLLCNGKNGVFVNNQFKAHSKDPYQLPENCNMRFPSTNLKIFLESCRDEELQMHQAHNQLIGTNLSNTSSLDGGVSPLHDYDCLDRKVTLQEAGSKHSATVQEDLLLPIQPSEGDEFPTISISTEKPAYSYAQLIVQAIINSPGHQLTLSSIYNFISRHYPYYKPFDKGWQNSIRHNLSLNRYFIRVPRSTDEPGKGAFWTIDSAYKQKLAAGAFRQRRSKGVAVYKNDLQPKQQQQSSQDQQQQQQRSYSPDAAEMDSLSNYIQQSQLAKSLSSSRDTSPEIRDPNFGQTASQLSHSQQQQQHQQQQQVAASTKVQLSTGAIVHTPKHQSASSNLIQWRHSIGNGSNSNNSSSNNNNNNNSSSNSNSDDNQPNASVDCDEPPEKISRLACLADTQYTSYEFAELPT